jgi:FeS assembly SUF system protein
MFEVFKKKSSHTVTSAEIPQSSFELPAQSGGSRENIIEALRKCYDPEIPVNIYELGLIYEIDIDEMSNVTISMTLTSPACPVAGTLPPEIEQKISALPGVNSVRVEVVWDPPWDPGKMTEAARLQLGLFY